MAAWLGKAQPQRGASEPIKWRAGTGSTGSVSFSSWLRQLIDIEAFSWGAVFTSDVDSLPGQTAKYEIRGGESYYFVGCCNCCSCNTETGGWQPEELTGPAAGGWGDWRGAEPMDHAI
jgi:hypothetical protein